jgi:putative two-component system response regulator
MTRGLWAGADDFLAKPVDPQDLVVRVRAGEHALGLEAHDAALFTLAKLVEWRGPEAEGHVERIRMYAQVLAHWVAEANREGYRIDARFIRTIYQTSPLHDIGMIGIQDAALSDPMRSLRGVMILPRAV